MLRTFPLAVAFLVLALLSPSASHAYGPWEIGRAQTVAAKAWPASPCAGQRVTVIRDETFVAPANQQNTRGLAAYVAMDTNHGLLEGCTVHLTPSTDDDPWPTICTTMLHEYGHLAGHGHTPTGLMRADGLYVDPRCEDRGRPYLGMAPSRAYVRLRAAEKMFGVEH